MKRDDVTRVLLVEDNQGDATYITGRLNNSAHLRFDVDHVEWLSNALTALRNRSYDLVFLDLSLPDSHGIDTIMMVKREAPNTPIIVLSGREDIDTATNSVRAGAQSFIVKRPGMLSDELEREALYAMERVRNDLTAKEIIRSSIERLTVDQEDPQFPAVCGMLAEHVTRVGASIDAVVSYLRKNHPAVAVIVNELLMAQGYYVAMNEIRSVLRLDEEYRVSTHEERETRRLRRRRISDMAMKVASGAGASYTPMDAEEDLLDIISGGTKLDLTDLGDG